MVVLLVSGRPLILDPIQADADALVAAWLPGTGGGRRRRPLRRTLAQRRAAAHSWPRNIAQVPINWGDAAYDPLFAYGYGLSY